MTTDEYDSFPGIQTRAVSEALNATGHDGAARAMLRVSQIAVLPASDGWTHVWILCDQYDMRLLSALTLSQEGARSRALDDAYACVFPWMAGPFKFHFVLIARGASGRADVR